MKMKITPVKCVCNVSSEWSKCKSRPDSKLFPTSICFKSSKCSGRNILLRIYVQMFLPTILIVCKI